MTSVVQVYEQPPSIVELWRAWRQRLRGDEEHLLGAFAHLTMPRKPTPENVERRISRAVALCDAALFMMWLAWIAPPEIREPLQQRHDRLIRRRQIDAKPSDVLAFVGFLIVNGVDDEDLAELGRSEFDQCWHHEADFNKAVMTYLFRLDIYLEPARRAQQDIRDLMRTMNDLSEFVIAAALREEQVETSDPVAALESLFAKILDDVQPLVAVMDYQSHASWTELYREALKHYGKRLNDGLEVKSFTRMAAMLTDGSLIYSCQDEEDQPDQTAGEGAESQRLHEPDLLMSIYIPNEQLYAAEQRRVLALFRDWLVKTRKTGIRQSERTTSRGAMFEYYADGSVSLPELKIEIDVFSHFLNKCADSPATALKMLSETQMSPVAATLLVTQFGKEVRRVEVDARHARERGMLTLRQILENTLLEADVDLRIVPDVRIDAILEELVPYSDASPSLPSLTGPSVIHLPPHVNVTVNQTIYNAMEQIIIEHVQGTVNLGAQAKEILALIDRFAAKPDVPTLTTAVHELEDPDAPADSRRSAKVKLKKFLTDLSGKVEDVALNILEKYLESKLGL